MNQSHGRRQRIKANSIDKLPPLLSTKNIATNEHQSQGSRKRLLQQKEPAQIQSEKAGAQLNRPKLQEQSDSNQNILLKQALGSGLVPINFEVKQRGKPLLGEMSTKARHNGNLSTINGSHNVNELSHEGQVMKARQAMQLKSSSNPSLRPAKNQAQGRSGSVNVEVNKHSINVSGRASFICKASCERERVFNTIWGDGATSTWRLASLICA